MIEDNLITRICIRIFSWGCSFAVPIVSLIYYVYYITQRKSLLVEWLPDTFFTEFLYSFSDFLHYWLGFELIFFVYFQVTKSRFQSHLPPVVPSKQVRQELINFCFHTIDEFENWIEGWFNIGHKKSTVNQIYRDNLAEWLAWSFFANSLDNVRNHPEYSKEINEMIELIEKHSKIKFRKGYNPNCECIKLTLDPVHAAPRSFAFYVIIFLLSFGFNILLKLYGFDHFGAKESIMNGYWSSTLEFDIHEGCPPSRISYWYYDPHSCCDSFPLKKKGHKKPIVFIHGVGGGLFGYFNFIRKLWKLDRPLFLVELPYVSMQMVEDVPTMEETVREIEEMLISRNYPKAIFVAQSLGTVVCAWMLKEARKRISGLVLIDPIIFLLHYSNVAYNFKYRIPQAANEHLFFFASSELYISHYFSRHFHWFQCILFISPRYILPHNTYIYLSEKDNLIPTKEVYKYLSKNNVNVRMMHKLDHGNFLFNSYWGDQIVGDVLKCYNSKSYIHDY
ncbi:Alpha/Beta hydrolase protein [Gigaspora margarita]|uniref:Alpha/Beta hydrolase protein n=1 Tax=Gigaspora margarita TaxID=4874 RepID=A0A8H3ZZP3_GIGMA|nr:Alpha/Beta hydrolase protein [Gigaspora margarita]